MIPNDSKYPDLHITVWEFKSVDGKQRTTGIRPCYPDDHRFQHEYQRIIYRGPRSKYVAQDGR